MNTSIFKINELIKELSLGPENLKLLEDIKDLLHILSSLDLELDLWKSQNYYFFLIRNILPQMKQRSDKADRKAEKWLALIQIVGKFLGVKSS